jgi:hypothetical protein
VNRSQPTPARRFARTVARLAAAGTAALAGAAFAQDFGAMIQQQMNLMNQRLAQGQQMVNQAVQQRMRDPQVQAQYQQHLAQARATGMPAMDFATFAYNHIYTRGFSRDGIEHARRTDAAIAGAEHAAARGVRQAEQARGQAQQGLRDSYFAGQQEAGRGLMGQSTYHGAGGAQVVLPHTWQKNTRHEYMGHTYHVDQTGQYYVRGADGWWYPVNR